MIRRIINPFAHEPPVTARADPRPFYPLWRHQFKRSRTTLSTNLQSAEWRDLSNHTGISTIQSRTPEKEGKNHVTLTWKSPWKSCSIAHLPFLSPNPKILKAFLKSIPTKMKPTKCPTRDKKKRGKKSEKRGEQRKRKVKFKTVVSLLNPKPISKFCFLCMPKLRKLIFCIWNRRPWSVWPVNGFVVGFSSL